MTGLSPILAEPLAPDCIGLAILLFVLLSFLHRRVPLGIRPTGHQHDIGRRLHEHMTHRHQ